MSRPVVMIDRQLLPNRIHRNESHEPKGTTFLKTRSLFLLAFVMLGTALPSLPAAQKLTVAVLPNNEIVIAVDSALHSEFGLAYPVTYQIGIPEASTNLALYRRYSSSASWTRVTEKTSADFFNAEEVIRFDYGNAIAYASCPFGSSTDTLFMKFTTGTGEPVPVAYRGISRYYDNRQAAVTLSADDWYIYTDVQFKQAISVFRSLGLWVTTGIITDTSGGNAWASFQSQLDSGLVEAASHSRTHLHVPYADVNGEVVGSKSEILSNLTLSPLSTSGAKEYLYVWIAPYGEFDTAVEDAASGARYLVSRLTTKSDTVLSAWKPEKRIYGPAGVTRELGAMYGGTNDTVNLNAAFDEAVATESIYHMMCHPEVMEWSERYTMAHLEHISGHKNLWYVGMGHLYVYHLLQDSTAGPVVVLPTVATNPVTNLTITAATLQGSVNPQGSTATCHFEYGTTTSYGSVTADTTLPALATPISLSATVTGLVSFTQYHYRLVARTAGGLTVYGADRTFSTLPPPPIVATLPATKIRSTSAQGNGTIDTRAATTSYHFVYGPTASYGSATPDSVLPAMGVPDSVAFTFTGLTPNTLYHYALVADNGSGSPVFGPDRTFTTLPPPPAVSTTPPTGIFAGGATLNGTVNPNGFTTTYHFDYGPTTAYGSSTPDTTAPAGSVAVTVSRSVTGLTPLTVYHYRLVANNGSDSSVAGTDQTFTTIPLPPVVTTAPATAVTFKSARAQGTIDPNGASAVYHFEFGKTPSYGSVTSDSTLPAGTGTFPVSAPLTGLEPETLYHYRLVANNGSGSAIYGDDRTFTSLPIPPPPTVITSDATEIAARSAAANGRINPRGAETVYRIEYGTTDTYGSVSADSLVAAGTDTVQVSVLLTGLAPTTTYHFRLVAENGSGSPVQGNDLTFTTVIPPPTITVSTASLPDFGGTKVETSSPASTYTFSGVDLTGDILVKAPAGFQVSKDNIVYDSVLTIAASGGVVPSTTMYCRFSPTLTEPYSGNIVHSSTGAVTRNVAVSGTGLEYYTHAHTLTKGWNIISSHVTPQDPNIAHVFQSLIDAAALVKGQDETGSAIENLPGIGWVNNIGDWLPTRGYYVKVASDRELTVNGPLTALPLTITLSTGWHIIGYPKASPMDAATAIQPLINAGKLVKVQDESGNAIENLPGIGWLNNIGNFTPGHGYYLKVSGATSLTYDSGSTTHKTIAARTAVATPARYRVTREGNPYSPMNIYLRPPAAHLLRPGMEIGIFDGDLLVGAAVLDNESLNAGIVPVVAGKDDPLTDALDGFIDQHSISIRLWDGTTDAGLPVTPLPGPEQAHPTLTFVSQGTLVLAMPEQASAGVADLESPALLECYPNPFNPSTTLTYYVSSPGVARLSVYNILGEEVSVIVDGFAPKGIHTAQWNGRVNNGSAAPSGVYLARLSLGGQVFTKRLMLVK